MWFEKLTGFKEESPTQVRANLEISGSTMTSRVNSRAMAFGRLETPTLAELRVRVLDDQASTGTTNIREVIADAKQLHADVANTNVLFQVASQFNLLEMPGPRVTPEDGVSAYSSDHTQGPATFPPLLM